MRGLERAAGQNLAQKGENEKVCDGGSGGGGGGGGGTGRQMNLHSLTLACAQTSVRVLEAVVVQRRRLAKQQLPQLPQQQQQQQQQQQR